MQKPSQVNGLRLARNMKKLPRMDNPWIKRLIIAGLLGGTIFGLARCVSWATTDSLKASDQLYNNVHK